MMAENTKKQRSRETFSDYLPRQVPLFYDYEFPKVSIIVPTKNSALTLSLTIQSVLAQVYSNLEVIIVDSGSKDGTIEIIKGYRNERISLYSVSVKKRFEMLNKGIIQATGDYLTFLFPGDYYLSHYVLMDMMTLALKNDSPDIVYCGTLHRFGRKEPEIFFRELTKPLLQLGQMPTSLQSCWFNKELFHKVGKFDPSLDLRGGYELFCRIIDRQEVRVISSKIVLTDNDLRVLSRKLIITYFKETLRLVTKYYGFWASVKALLKQKSLARYLKLWWHSLKVALLGVKS